MPLIQSAPERVGFLVKAEKVAEQQSGLKAAQLQREQAPLFRQHHSRLRQVFGVAQDAAGEGLRVFGDALRVEVARLLPQVVDGVVRGGKRQGGGRRIEGERREVAL